MVAGQDNQCLVAVRYGSAGQRVSVASMTGAGSLIAIDAFGGIFANAVRGEIRKFDGTTGGTLWKASAFSGLIGLAAEVEAIAVDPNGDAIVSGRTTETLPRIATSKVDGATGSPRWPSPALSDSIVHWEGIPLLMALDRAGDVFLVGNRSTGPSNQGIAILKYAGATGSPSWSR